MKSFMRVLPITALIAFMFLTACDENQFDSMDTTPPARPKNVYLINGDRRVDIFWDYNSERDLAGYNIYYSYSHNGKYEWIGSTENDYYIDWEAVNGDEIYYGVTAYDYDGNESDLSIEMLRAVPRPEGKNVSLINTDAQSGYDISSKAVVAWDDQNADFYWDNDATGHYLNVFSDTEIVDMGVTTDIYDIFYAPETGWDNAIKAGDIKYVKAIPGHTYVVWTWDNKFAKIRVNNIISDRLTFDWSYQTVQGERMLKDREKTRTILNKLNLISRRNVTK